MARWIFALVLVVGSFSQANRELFESGGSYVRHGLGTGNVVELKKPFELAFTSCDLTDCMANLYYDYNTDTDYKGRITLLVRVTDEDVLNKVNASIRRRKKNPLLTCYGALNVKDGSAAVTRIEKN